MTLECRTLLDLHIGFTFSFAHWGAVQPRNKRNVCCIPSTVCVHFFIMPQLVCKYKNNFLQSTFSFESVKCVENECLKNVHVLICLSNFTQHSCTL